MSGGTLFLACMPRSSRLRAQWEFCAILSLLQPLADLFLVKVLGTLAFDAAPLRIGGEVPAAMLGMWTIALLPVLRACDELVKAGCVSFIGFGLAEHLSVPLRLWHPTAKVTRKIGDAALYVLVAEAVLGACVVYCEHATRRLDSAKAFPWGRVWGAAATVVMYTGALSLAWLLLEA